jgi:hypothetical protein
MRFLHLFTVYLFFFFYLYVSGGMMPRSSFNNVPALSSEGDYH